MTTAVRSNAALIALAAGVALQACAPTPTTDTTDSGLKVLRPAEELVEPNAEPGSETSAAGAAKNGDSWPASDELTQLAEASALALEELFAAGTLDRPAATASTDPENADAATPDPSPEPESQPTSKPETDLDPTPDASDLPLDPPTLDERVADLAGRLAVLLRERGEAHADLASELPTLAALDAINADGLGPWLDPAYDGLAPHEHDLATRLRDLHRALNQRPDAPGEAIADAAAAFLAGRPLHIETAVLCTRVEGFARYTPLERDTFLAGRAHRVIVYTQVEGFASTPLDDAGVPLPPAFGSALPPAGHRVELSQELLLYHDADGLLAWRRPPETSLYESRSPVRDFFMVDAIQLPRTLTVGMYHLKVVVRDAATDAVDERIIPIRVVADPALAAR